MVVDRSSGKSYHRMFYDLLALLRAGDALVLNETKVIPARIEAFRSSGGRVEVFLLERKEGECWTALVRSSSRLKQGERLTLHGGGSVHLAAYQGDGVWQVTFSNLPGGEEPGRIGRMPLPHYITRDKHLDPRDALDRERYQTVYATQPGAVAAPTAGLHFTDALLEQIAAKGVSLVKLTLHVGIGTFAPVREEDFTRHRMHPERFVLPEQSAEVLNRVRAAGGRVLAVGTTSARVLETLASEGGTIKPASGETRLFIYPPFPFKAVDLLLTNFHLPKSTLLLLVSAFAGRELVMAAYKEAVEKKYRFYSYGDAMLLGDGLVSD
jgi:S-adenosylmethionine:tRNA ribosyltransferase-isomerase